MNLLGSVTVPTNFLRILDDAVNVNMTKAAEKKGMAVQELFMIFQESGWQKDAANNSIQLDAISRKYEVTKVSENKVDTEYKQECLVCAS